MTDRIAELRALIAAEQAAHKVMWMSSNVPRVDRIRARYAAADAMHAAMERDVPALLDCVEALEDTLKLLGYAEPSEIWERSDIKERIARNRAALARLNGDDHD